MKKSKNTSLTSIEIALQKQCKPDRNAVVKAFEAVEKSRKDFTINAIKFGLCALTAKSIIGHGGFYDWLSDALKSENGLTRPVAERTAKDYIGLAKILVEKLKDPSSLKDELGERVRDYCMLMNIDFAKFDIAYILEDAITTKSLLDVIVKDMSLTKLRQLLREGAENAYAEKTESVKQIKTQTHQLSLWDDWTNELNNLDNLLQDPAKDQLEPTHWMKIEKKLEAQLAEVRKITSQF